LAKQSKQVRNQITGEGERINRERSGMSDIFGGRLPQAQQRADQTYGDVYKGYTDIYNKAGQPGAYGSYFKNAADTGLVTPENTARMRGGGVFDEFAKTGGLSDADVTNLRARGTSTIPSYYDAVRNQFQNQNRIQGGTNPSYGSSMGRIARDQSRGASEAALGTELGITQQRNAGRQWGAGQMSDAERALADLTSANKKFGISGGAGYENQNRAAQLAAMGGLSNLRESTPGEEFGLYQMLLNNMGGRESAYGQNTGQRMAYDPNISWMDRLSQILGTIGGLGQNFNISKGRRKTYGGGYNSAGA